MAPAGVALAPEEWEIVRGILLRHVPDRAVWAFGSRVKGRVKPFSDLDLAVLGETRLPPETYAGLVEDFTECDLPYKVDVLDWALTSRRFQERIESAHVMLLPGPPKDLSS